ncbi:MAG: DUF502 domain-containing protein [Panacagrimonas sp.]
MEERVVGRIRLWWNQYRKRLGWRRLARTFLTGLFAALPIMVTVAFVMWLIGFAEKLLGGFIKVLLPSSAYLPGMGLLISLALIFVTGLLMQAIFFRELVSWVEEQLERIPLIKTVYSAVKDLTGFFSKRDERRFGKVVLVQMPGVPVRMLGFITVEDLASAGLGMEPSDCTDQVAVYLPMSYQIGGYTVLLPRSYLTPLDMGMDDAMRFLITAGMSRSPAEAVAPKNGGGEPAPT